MQIGNQFLHFSIVGKFDGDEEEKEFLEEVNGVAPKFGFNYWFWMPKLKIRNRGTISMYDFKWLCFISSWDNYNLMGKG